MTGRRQILVVEDTKADVFLIREAIRAAAVDADIQVVQDGQMATEFFDASDSDEGAPCPDLVLLDLNLPKKSGDEVLKHMRKSIKCRNALVLIMTSSDAPQDRETAAELDAAGYFRKPLELSEFLKLGPIVQRLLELAEARL